MGLISDNPVLEREVRGRLRLKRKGGQGVNLWIVRAIGLIAAYYYVRGLLAVWHGTQQDARDFWPLLVYGALVLIVLLAPALSATAITQEREQQTWENLTTTQLSAWEVLLGKWMGRQLVPVASGGHPAAVHGGLCRACRPRLADAAGGPAVPAADYGLLQRFGAALLVSGPADDDCDGVGTDADGLVLYRDGGCQPGDCDLPWWELWE